MKFIGSRLTRGEISLEQYFGFDPYADKKEESFYAAIREQREMRQQFLRGQGKPHRGGRRRVAPITLPKLKCLEKEI